MRVKERPESPLASLARAQQAVRERIAHGGLGADVVVVIRGGTYELPAPLAFGPQDSGTEKHSITYMAYPGERVVVRGGSTITGWKRGPGEIWTADVPGVKDGSWCFRNLYVNHRRAVRARTPNRDDKEPHWQLKGAELSPDLKRLTVTLAPGLVKNWSNVSDIEVMIAGNWEINRKRVRERRREPPASWCWPRRTSAGPSTSIPPRAAGATSRTPIEMLDQPGEWYLDRRRASSATGRWPGEDMTRAEVVAPRSSNW